MLLVEATAPLLRATLIAVLRKPSQPLSCVLSFKNVPNLTKAVKQSNGHPNRVAQSAAGGRFSISQKAYYVDNNSTPTMVNIRAPHTPK